MKKIEYNSFDALLKQLVYFFTTLLVILLGSTYLIANELNYKEIISEGRAVIINDDVGLAKKRALEDALYLASIQGGAKIDGFSSIDKNTSLNESVLVRPSATIKDFVIVDEKIDKTHYVVKIMAYLVDATNLIDCAGRDFVNISYLAPHFTISSRLPAWTHKLPNIISSSLTKNLKEINFINLNDLSKMPFNSSNVLKKSIALDYNNLVEGKSNALKYGEFAVHPTIRLDYTKGRLTRVSKEMIVDISLKIYEGPSYKVIDTLNYSFSLWIGNKTGYPELDGFYRVSKDKLTHFVKRSVSKIQYRVLDKLKCHPLQAKIKLIDNKLTIPLGANQGLKRGTVGFVSDSKDIVMSDWIVLTVRNSEEDYSIVEPLNSSNKKEEINGRIIKFLN